MTPRLAARRRWISAGLVAAAVLLVAACTITHVNAALPAAAPAPSTSSLAPPAPAATVAATTSTPATPPPTPTAHRPTATPTHTKPPASTGTTCPAYNAAIKGQFDAGNVVTAGNGNPTVFTLNPKILAACPTLQLKLALATYTAPGASPPTLTLFSQSTAILSAAHPHATLPAIKTPLPGCAKTVLLTIMLPGNKSMPHQVPRSPDHIQDPFTALGARMIFSPSWGTPDC